MVCRALILSLVAAVSVPLVTFAQSDSGPEVGSKVDEFSLLDQHGTSHKLSELVSKAPVALVVYRSADW